jgi:hypothetical protein
MPVHIEDWNQTGFFEYGSPPLITITQNIFHSDEGVKQITFIPQYGVLKNNLEKEGSVYVMLEESGNPVSFYFYQSKHPDGPHYNINITHYSVDVCDKSNKCRKLIDCEKAVRVVLF